MPGWEVAPGAIATDFSGGMVRDNPEINKRVAEMTALGRAGLPDDIGPMLGRFACSHRQPSLQSSCKRGHLQVLQREDSATRLKQQLRLSCQNHASSRRPDCGRLPRAPELFSLDPCARSCSPLQTAQRVALSFRMRSSRTSLKDILLSRRILRSSVAMLMLTSGVIV
jgi:hypothetical protein